MRIAVQILVSFALVLSLSFAAFAQSYTVGVENIDYYPIYSGFDGEYKGYAREVLDAFAAAKGYTFTYKPLPIKRLFQSYLADKELDFKFPDNPYWSAEMREGLDVVYSEPVVDYIDGVLVKPENKGNPLDAFKTLGIIAGFTAWEFLDRIKAGQVVTDESGEYEKLLEKAIRGRVDGAYSSVAVALYQLREVLKQPEALVFDPSLPHTRSAYLLSSVKHHAVIAEFNKFLAENAAQVMELKQKYKAEAGVN